MNGRPDTVTLLAGTRHTLPTTNQWTTFLDELATDTLGYRHVLQLWNGFGSSNRISSGTLTLDGNPILSSTDLNSNTTYLNRVLFPAPLSYLVSSLYGNTGSFVDLNVLRIPNPTFEFWGPQEFVRPAGGPLTQTIYFPRPAKSPYPTTIHVVNGNANGTNRVTSGLIMVNGVTVFDLNSWGVGVARRDRQVSLYNYPTNSQLYVRINNPPSSKFTISFSATDQDSGDINLTQPVEGQVTSATKLFFTGTTIDESFGTLTMPVTGTTFATPTRPPAIPAFGDSIPLAGTEGAQSYQLSMVNRAGYRTTMTRTIVRDTQPPILNVISPSEQSQTLNAASIGISGNWHDVSRTTLTVDGDTVSAIDTSGTFAATVPLDLGPNRILIRARDAVGHVTNVWRFVNRAPENEDAADSTVSGPAAAQTGVSSFFESNQFLLETLQTGELPNSVRPEQSAVVRGQVLSRDFGELRNVTVRILGQEDTLGQTLTRKDGRFDLMVNGGRAVTLRFSKSGYLESQRTIKVPVNDFVTIDAVAMIGKSSRFTVADLTAPATTVRSRFESDLNGDRSLTMLFRQGTQAKAIRGMGDTVALPSTVTVRAKEFTVGSSGLPTMPAVLPASTAYTYCVDLSLDEAEALAPPGATMPEVRFDKPIPCYVKDFLQLPIGTVIPAGYYDPRRAQWVASTDGCVIKLVGVDAGLALVDADSIPGADTPGHLDSLGFDSAERSRLAEQYAVGDTLWRVQVDHFSSWDFNLNLAWLAYSNSPSAARARRRLGLTKCKVKRQGSIIDCENRVLGEEIPVVGTPYSLNYQSYRVPGDVAMRKIRIPVSGPSIPDEVDRMFVVVDVAGQQLKQEFPAGTEVYADVVWNGLDAYGRRVQGSVTAQVAVGYRYDQKYGIAVNPGSSMGEPGSNGTLVRETEGDRAVGRIVWTRQSVSVGAPSMASAGLGSWTLSPHHFYDMTGSGTLYFGDGGFRSGDEMYPVINRYAGGGTGLPTDGSPVLGVAIAPQDIAMGPDGLLYFINSGTSTIHRISRDGKIYRIAGNGTFEYDNGDGLPALQASLGNPTTLTIGPDGAIYFTSAGQFINQVRVRKVTPDGIIHTIAGTGEILPSGASNGDGGPATAARFVEPRGIAVGPDGSVFVGDVNHDTRVRRIAPNGLISTYAGNGVPVSALDQQEGRASEIGIGPVTGLLVDRDGVLYIADAQHVLRVTPDGNLTKHTGASVNFHPRSIAMASDGALLVTSYVENLIYRRDQDGTLLRISGGGGGAGEEGMIASAAPLTLHLSGLAVGEDGSIYTNEVTRIRRISTTLPTGAAGEFAIPAEDGSEKYVFDTRGRHLRTLDALTGAVLRRFTYDLAGRLLSIVDANNDETVILRSPDGKPTGIRSPYGLVTGLTTTSTPEGYLQTIVNPNNETTTLGPDSEGLLWWMRDAKDQPYSFGYDAEGRLESDTDPANGTQTLSSTDTLDKRTVTYKDAMTRPSVHVVKRYYDGYLRHEVTGPDNFRSIYVDSTDGGGQWIARVSPAGDSIRVRPRPETRFGMLAVIDSGVTVVFPNGLKHHLAVTRPYNKAGFDPPTQTSSPWLEDVQVNSKPIAHTSFTISGGTRTLLRQSAAGRTTTTTVDSAGRPLSVAVPGITPVVFDYDTRGRLTHLTQGPRQWTWDFDDSGRVYRVTDPASRESFQQYDAANRVIRQTLPGARVASYGYDANGNLTAFKPPSRELLAFSPTPVNLLSSYSLPDLGQGPVATTYQYAQDRQLRDVLRPTGDSVHLDYDAAGRLWKVVQARGTSTLGYSTATGQSQSVTSPDGVTLNYGYNGSLLTSETWTGAVSGSVTWDYDPELLPRTETVVVGPATSTVTNHFDADGLLTQVDLPGGVAYSIARRTESGSNTDNGQVDSTQVGNVVESRNYNAHGELTNLRYRFDTRVLLQQSLTRDGLGRVTHLTEVVDSVTRETTYGYDLAGRLNSIIVAGSTAASRTYEYDENLPGNGNRTGERDGTGALIAQASYDHQDRIMGCGSATYAWTAAGEQALRSTPADTLSTSYDPLGNLVSAGHKTASASGPSAPITIGTTYTFEVDGQNRRVRKLVDGAPVQGWLYRDGLHPVAELDGAGAMLNRYVYATHGHVPDLLWRSGSIYRVLTDHVGSVRAIVNVSTGTVAQRIDYDAWGNLTLDTAPAFQSLGYAGGIQDRDTRLVRFGARDYEPGTGRWTTRDPRGPVSTVSDFSYADSDPINGFDPDGRETAGTHFGYPPPPSPWERAVQAGREAERHYPGAALDSVRNAVRHAAAAQQVARQSDYPTAIAAVYLWEWAHCDFNSADTRADIHNGLMGARYPRKSVDDLLREGRLVGPGGGRIPPVRSVP